MKNYISLFAEIMLALLSSLQLHMVAKNVGMHHNEWMEIADRWVPIFLGSLRDAAISWLVIKVEMCIVY